MTANSEDRVIGPRPPLTVCYPVNYLGFGGAERQLVELVKGLDKDRFNVVVVTLLAGGPLEAELSDQPGVAVESLNRRSKYSLREVASLARTLRQCGAQIIQPFLTPATLFGLSASFVAHTPVRIVTERCGVRRNRHLGNKIYRFVEDRLTKHADVVVANSKAGAGYLVRRGVSPEMIHVIYNGIDRKRLDADPERVATIRHQLRVPPGGLVVGNIASLTPYKDQATLLRAVATVSAQFPNIRVALVGDGYLRHELEKLAGTLGLSSRVVFFGYQHRVADFIEAFDVAVLSSADNEGCSNFLLEAMALGKPVVATDIGGNGELVEPGKNGLLVPVGDHQAMASAIGNLLNNSEMQRQMGTRGRNVVEERFSLSGMVNSYQDLYWKLAQQKLGFHASPDKVAA